MRIQCPTCAATYQVADALLSPGRGVKCGQCGLMFAPLAPLAPPPELMLQAPPPYWPPERASALESHPIDEASVIAPPPTHVDPRIFSDLGAPPPYRPVIRDPAPAAMRALPVPADREIGAVPFVPSYQAKTEPPSPEPERRRTFHRVDEQREEPDDTDEDMSLPAMLRREMADVRPEKARTSRPALWAGSAAAVMMILIGGYTRGGDLIRLLPGMGSGGVEHANATAKSLEPSRAQFTPATAARGDAGCPASRDRPGDQPADGIFVVCPDADHLMTPR